MKIFGIGFHRTGTTTLNECLKSLGFSHKGYDLDLLRHVDRGNLTPVRRVADQHECFDDWPWPLIFRRLDAWHPEAKFILTIREDPETWLSSVKRHAKVTGPTESRQIIYGQPRVEGHEDIYLDRYTKHNQAVRQYFADCPDDLLEICWETGSGWQELCDFLNMEVPDRPLPHANESSPLERLTMVHKRWQRLIREKLGMQHLG
jgi:hypothetical protein